MPNEKEFWLISAILCRISGMNKKSRRVPVSKHLISGLREKGSIGLIMTRREHGIITAQYIHVFKLFLSRLPNTNRLDLGDRAGCQRITMIS